MTVEGLASLNRKLTRTIPAQAVANARVALEQSADQIVAMMKRLCPVLEDEKAGRRPGALRDSIDWTWGKVPKGSTSFGAVKTGPQDRLRITIFCGGTHAGDDVFWQWWVEFGTQTAAAKPFFFPSWRSMRRGAKSRVTRAMLKGMRPR